MLKRNFCLPLIKKEYINPKIVTRVKIGTVILITVTKALAVTTDKRKNPIITTYKIIEVTKEAIDTFKAFLKNFFI